MADEQNTVFGTVLDPYTAASAKPSAADAAYAPPPAKPPLPKGINNVVDADEIGQPSPRLLRPHGSPAMSPGGGVGSLVGTGLTAAFPEAGIPLQVLLGALTGGAASGTDELNRSKLQGNEFDPLVPAKGAALGGATVLPLAGIAHMAASPAARSASEAIKAAEREAAGQSESGALGSLIEKLLGKRAAIALKLAGSGSKGSFSPSPAAIGNDQQAVRLRDPSPRLGPVYDPDAMAKDAAQRAIDAHTNNARLMERTGDLPQTMPGTLQPQSANSSVKYGPGQQPTQTILQHPNAPLPTYPLAGNNAPGVTPTSIGPKAPLDVNFTNGVTPQPVPPTSPVPLYEQVLELGRRNGALRPEDLRREFGVTQADAVALVNRAYADPAFRPAAPSPLPQAAITAPTAPKTSYDELVNFVKGLGRTSNTAIERAFPGLSTKEINAALERMQSEGVINRLAPRGASAPTPPVAATTAPPTPATSYEQLVDFVRGKGGAKTSDVKAAFPGLSTKDVNAALRRMMAEGVAGPKAPTPPPPTANGGDPLAKRLGWARGQSTVSAATLRQRFPTMSQGDAVRVLGELDGAGLLGPASGSQPRTVLAPGTAAPAALGGSAPPTAGGAEPDLAALLQQSLASRPNPKVNGKP